MDTSSNREPAAALRVGGRGVLFLLVLSAIAVASARVLLSAPTADLLQLAGTLLASGSISVIAAVAMTTARPQRILATVRGKLILVVLVSATLVIVNVALTGYLMFLSAHDLKLMFLLLGFSLGMSAFVAAAISDSFTSRVSDLLQNVRRLGTGDLTTRSVVRGGDELDELAAAFNRMAEELERAASNQRDLEQARRVLIAAVSHDLRSPLATMRAMTESINDGVVTDPPTIQRYLATIQNEIGYLSRLIDDLFDLSQIDAGALRLNCEPAQVADIISDTVEALSAQACQRNLTLTGDVEGSLPIVNVDTPRIQRVLYNLLQNAVRHTPVDGTIRICALDAGPELRVSVADTGDGIEPDELARVFERFHRGDRARSRADGGSGLGLSIARSIVELHGGRIWAESGVGNGSVFTFTLPKR